MWTDIKPGVSRTVLLSTCNKNFLLFSDSSQILSRELNLKKNNWREKCLLLKQTVKLTVEFGTHIPWIRPPPPAPVLACFEVIWEGIFFPNSKEYVHQSFCVASKKVLSLSSKITHFHFSWNMEKSFEKRIQKNNY